MNQRPLAAALASLLLAALAACGSSGSTSTSSTGSTQPVSGAGAVAAVTAAYSTLFNLADPAVEPKVAVVQDGESLRSTLTSELRSPLAKQATGATVTAVAVQPAATCAQQALPSPCAIVDYNILSKTGKPLFPTASKGYAVYSGGKWLVAKETICGLLSLAGNAMPAGCA